MSKIVPLYSISSIFVSQTFNKMFCFVETPTLEEPRHARKAKLGRERFRMIKTSVLDFFFRWMECDLDTDVV